MPIEQKAGDVLAMGVKTDDFVSQTFPARTEGSVKKHWYKDMHYAEFAEDEVRITSAPVATFANVVNLLTVDSLQSAALMSAIKEYENNKWKVIGQKVGKPAKACEQYAKEHFPGKQPPPPPGQRLTSPDAAHFPQPAKWPEIDPSPHRSIQPCEARLGAVITKTSRGEETRTGRGAIFSRQRIPEADCESASTTSSTCRATSSSPCLFKSV